MTSLPQPMRDPLRPAARFLRAAKRFASECRTILRSIGGSKPSGGRIEPFLDYRGELDGEPRGRALLVYLAQPFHVGAASARQHDYSNWIMSLELANALNRLGFSVDIVDWTDLAFTPSRDYDVFIGMTGNFSRLLPMMGPQTRIIYWATRPEASAELESIRQRQIAAQRRRGRMLHVTDAILPLLESADFHRAHAVLLIGNQTTRRSFSIASLPVHCINNPALPFDHQTATGRDFGEARRHFLFLSSWLLLRKGLDLVLEAFAATPDLHLWICAPVDSEPDFLEEYRAELFHTRNIHTLGWTAMQSREFDEVCRQCAFLVFPSCAEGMSGSVINGMSRGLVPVCTEEAGVDVAGFGFTLANATPDALRELVMRAAQTEPGRLAEMSRLATGTAASEHSVTHFRTQVEGALRETLQG